ncbi:AbiV family abortive infection protein [Arthrobacter sp. R-11]|uniref:AbiV family abortive infection protein n=1 Tax=Arthrobacter sp. R-11 TaxID=3404053 RepID=UPI003CF1D0EC
MWREQREKAESAGKEANLLKQRGFYVDQGKDGSIQTPADTEQGALAQDLNAAAQVIEMLLIKDHIRMKHDSTGPYDGRHSTQFRLLPISHPEDCGCKAKDFERQPTELLYPVSLAHFRPSCRDWRWRVQPTSRPADPP